MHYSVGWHINSVCCTHHFVGWYITLFSVRSSLSVDTVLCRLYALHWWLVYYSVSCTHLATLSVWHFTLLVEHITLLAGRITLSVVHTTLSVLNIYLSVVCTTLPVVNMYPVGCMHYFVSCKHLLCELYILLLVGTLLFLLYAPVCWLVHYSVSCRTTFLVGPITLLYALWTACFICWQCKGFSHYKIR